MSVRYCVEFSRSKCRTPDGIIGTDPSHCCIVCKRAIHSICELAPTPSTREEYAPNSPPEGSGAKVICSECNITLVDRDMQVDVNSIITPLQEMDNALPNNVGTFRYNCSEDPPVRRIFSNHIHIACASGSSPFTEAVMADRKHLILPGIPTRSFCADEHMKMAPRTKKSRKS